mmetsp:Transcript_1087/g.1907  ORF Transcript_1087/g.1907 Transcript_1087/m.1907 type:complete len:180 (+) Transcript_1087:115-654(+)
MTAATFNCSFFVFATILAVAATCMSHGFSSLERDLRGIAHIVEYDNVTLLSAISRANTCTVLCVGATWDGHFRAWVNRQAWKTLADSLRNYHNSRDIEVGYIFYNHYPLPVSLKHIWSSSPPSYDVKVFKGGVALRNISLEHELRSAYHQLRSSVWMDVVTLCSDFVAAFPATSADTLP